MPVALSAKRSLGGQTGRLSENILRNGMTDNKIGGRYNGQMGGNGTHGDGRENGQNRTLSMRPVRLRP